MLLLLIYAIYKLKQKKKYEKIKELVLKEAQDEKMKKMIEWWEAEANFVMNVAYLTWSESMFKDKDQLFADTNFVKHT